MYSFNKSEDPRSNLVINIEIHILKPPKCVGTWPYSCRPVIGERTHLVVRNPQEYRFARHSSESQVTRRFSAGHGRSVGTLWPAAVRRDGWGRRAVDKKMFAHIRGAANADTDAWRRCWVTKAGVVHSATLTPVLNCRSFAVWSICAAPHLPPIHTLALSQLILSSTATLPCPTEPYHLFSPSIVFYDVHALRFPGFFPPTAATSASNRAESRFASLGVDCYRWKVGVGLRFRWELFFSHFFFGPSGARVFELDELGVGSSGTRNYC